MAAITNPISCVSLLIFSFFLVFFQLLLNILTFPKPGDILVHVWSGFKLLPKLNICLVNRNISNKYANFSKPHRQLYARLYPTLLVNSDGSTVTIRHPDPSHIIQLPLDLATLTEEERKARIERRKPKKKMVIQDDIQDTYDSNKYVKFIKKK